jgi:transaldolase
VSPNLLIIRIIFQLVELGIAILDRISGPHFTFIDPRYHANTNAMIKRARSLVALFEKSGIDRSRVVISIPSTESGVQATRVLSVTDHFNVNLTLISDLSHATICAEAGAAYLTFNFVAVSATHFQLFLPKLINGF